MKKLIPFVLLIISSLMYGQKIDSISIQSKVFNENRKLWIYLPEQYFILPEKRFEVAYVFDAQARQYFDAVHSTISFVNGGIPIIVVGVVSNYSEEKKENRNSDFLPKPDNEETINKYGGYLGRADNFLDYFQNEVIKYIDSNYRTFPYRIGIGHSNGATFLSYCLLEKPELIDAYILVSPNYGYDKEQLVKRFGKFNPESLKHNKFISMCNSNEGEEWINARNKVISLLNTDNFKTKIYFSNRDYSKTENHGTVFPVAIFYGLKEFIDYKYLTAENVISYNDELEKNKLLNLDAKTANDLAYNCFWNEKTQDAIKIIHWAIRKFPADDNLYDSQGEFYEKAGDISIAKESYKNALKVLQSNKSQVDAKTFEEKFKSYNENYERLNK
jgi:predicted alpha/beta superfamily hydrolase